MMKNTVLIIICFIGIISCSDTDAEPEISADILTGNFIEVTPESDRTTLIFSSGSNQLEEKRITDGEDPASRTFSVRLLENDMIELSSNEADVADPGVFHYQIIDDDKFEIGNINENDPEETIMTFQRNQN